MGKPLRISQRGDILHIHVNKSEVRNYRGGYFMGSKGPFNDRSGYNKHEPLCE